MKQRLLESRPELSLKLWPGAAMAQAATQSVLTCQDEDTTDTTHRAKLQRTDSDGFELEKIV